MSEKVDWSENNDFPDVLSEAQNGFSVDVLAYFECLDEHTVAWFDFNQMQWQFLRNQDYGKRKFKWRYFNEKYDYFEFWKDVDGFEGLYQVSTQGRVRSLDRYCNAKNGSTRFMKGKILKYKICPRLGYYRVVLCGEDERKTFSVARLVALHFIDNQNNLPEVNHIDEVKSNNCVSNLEWISRIDNIRHGTGIQRSANSRTKKNKK